MNKGVVMEKSGKHLIVMTPAGSFERIPDLNRNCQVGEEIMYVPAERKFRQPAFAVLSAFVAAVVLCMMLFTAIPAAFADKSVVAYISIDINPSVELGIDKSKKVREVKGLNDKGLELVRNLSYSGKPLEDVTDKLLQKAEDMNLFASGEGDIVIASAVVKEDAKLDDNLVTEEMKQQVMAHVVMKHPDEADKIEVTAFSAPPEIVETAKENGLSLGKYSVYLNAKSTGHDIKVDDLKKDSVHNIANVEGGISKLVDTSKFQKDSIKELIKEEKDGSLDKKVQDMKKETPSKSGQKATPTPKPTKKPAAPTPTPKATNKPAAPSPAKNTPERSGPRDAPGSNDGKNAPGKNDDKNNPGTNNGKNTPDRGGVKNTPGRDDGKNTPEKNDGRNPPGRDDGKNTPGRNDDKNSPGRNTPDRGDRNDDRNGPGWFDGRN